MSRNSDMRAIAEAVISDDCGSVRDEIRSVLDLSDYICTCDRCGDEVMTDDTRPVDGEYWCESCRDNHAYYWESDDEYHSEPEPEDEDDCIPDYHDTDLAIPDECLEKNNVLGIELETYQRDCEAAADFLGEIRRKSGDQLKFERDGSLDDENGVEIVCRPYTLQEIRDGIAPWKSILEWCRENRGKAWDAGDNYGTHISLNGAAMTKLHRSKVVRFFNSQKSLCEKVAGRTENRWSKYQTKGKLSEEHKPTEKYQAAANREDRIEVRIFRASLIWGRFVRNCEFTDSVRVFCLQSGNREIDETNYRGWLAKPENLSTYPLISSFLGLRKEPKEMEEKCAC